MGKEFHVKFTEKTVNHGDGNIMVWGWFFGNRVGPILRIENFVNSAVYRDILQNVIPPLADEEISLLQGFAQNIDPKNSFKYVKI